jgi:hypothetical protein
MENDMNNSQLESVAVRNRWEKAKIPCRFPVNREQSLRGFESHPLRHLTTSYGVLRRVPGKGTTLQRG